MKEESARDLGYKEAEFAFTIDKLNVVEDTLILDTTLEEIGCTIEEQKRARQSIRHW